VCRIAELSADTRDTSVQILDKFLSLSLATEASVLADSNFISIAAAVAIILSSKMHDSPPLRMCAFSHFAVDDLVKFEYKMLTKLEYFIVPLASPVSFVRHLLHVGVLDDDLRHSQEVTLTHEANIIVGHYWQGNESLLFPPSVIAFASLVIAFSKLNLECRCWLDSLPDQCFHGMSTTISDNVLKKYPDMYPSNASASSAAADGFAFERVLITVDLCIRSMKAIPAISSYLTPVIAVATPSAPLIERALVLEGSSQEDEAEIAGVSSAVRSPTCRTNNPSPTGVVDCLEELGLGSPKQQQDKPTVVSNPSSGVSEGSTAKSLFYPDETGSKRKRGASGISLLSKPKRKSSRTSAVSPMLA
jgi:hypothetical protein